MFLATEYMQLDYNLAAKCLNGLEEITALEPLAWK